MASVKWTDEQQAAIDKKGSNILVAAAAGSGSARAAGRSSGRSV